jgi:hypothetical protein
MKTSSSRIWCLVPVGLSLTAAGCVTSETYTLNEVSLSGPIARTPINVTIDPVPGTVQLIPGFAVDNAPVIKGTITPVPGPAAQPAKTSVAASSGGNLTWDVPASEYSLDLQWTATQHFGLGVGGVYATAGGYQFTNFRGGISFFTVDNQFGIRLDAGAQFNAVRFRSRATVTELVEPLFTSPHTYVSNFDDMGVEQSIGAALGLTINSAYSESFVNGFLHLGVAWQPLIDYRPTRPDSIAGPGDGRAAIGNLKSTSAVLSFGGGIAIELGRGNRALVGVRGAQLLEVDSPAPGPVWQPFVEFVFSF